MGVPANAEGFIRKTYQMKNIFKYIVFLFLASTYTSCFNARKINNKIVIDKEYDGWFIGTSNGIFFVVDREGLFKRNIAFSLGGFRPFCQGQKEAYASFFNSVCEKRNDDKKSFFIIGHNDSTSFDQNVSIYKAKAFYEDFDTTYIEHAIRKKQRIVYKIRANDGRFSIRAIWVDGFVDLRNLVLFSNCTKDSLNYYDCPTRKKPAIK